MIERHRIDDWQAILYSLLDEKVELIYGISDCFLHSCSMVEKISGIDYADQIRGTYSNEQEAQAMLDKWGNISGYLTQRIGPPLDHVLQAHVGDLVTLRDGDIEVLGVCTGWRVAFINHPPRTGLRSVRLDLCDKAWST